MKRLVCHLVVASALLVCACDSNKKLGQENAEKAIRTSLPTLTSADTFGVGQCFQNPQSISSIEAVSQFSETEATSVVSFKCASESFPFGVKFVFKKNIDNKWLLTNLACADGFKGYGCDHTGVITEVQHNQNLKVVAQ